LFVWKYLVVCVWEERRESQAKRREEWRKAGTKNFSLQFWGGRKILQFQGLEKRREENLEDEIVLGFFSFLISVSFVINPVPGGDFE
jgi:hypothetical protein